jgi:hypothetical protein
MRTYDRNVSFEEMIKKAEKSGGWPYVKKEDLSHFIQRIEFEFDVKVVSKQLQLGYNCYHIKIEKGYQEFVGTLCDTLKSIDNPEETNFSYKSLNRSKTFNQQWLELFYANSGIDDLDYEVILDHACSLRNGLMEVSGDFGRSLHGGDQLELLFSNISNYKRLLAFFLFLKELEEKGYQLLC